MLKQTSASIGLVIAAAAGVQFASSPAHAAVPQGGWHSHHRSSHHSHHRNHNWNGNRHHRRIFIRIYIYNKNNNHAVAVARPEHREERPASYLGEGPFFGSPNRGTVTGQAAAPAGPEIARPTRVVTGTVPVA